MGYIKKNVAFILIVCGISCTQKQSQTNAENLGWKISMKSYTFRLFTVIEALEKTHALGIKYIEMSSNQKVGGDIGEDKFNYKLTHEQREKLKKIAKANGVKIVSTSMGVPNTTEWEKIFLFAKDMDMEYITAEPAPKDWDLVEKLAIKFNIKVACHNHPSEKSYWKPGILLYQIQNRSKLLGACCDIGHYKRMDLDPVKCLQKLSGRIIALDFKDIAIDSTNYTFEDVVIGQGLIDIKGVMKELKAQNFQGYFTIEYEANWENNICYIKESIEYFNQVADEIWDSTTRN